MKRLIVRPIAIMLVFNATSISARAGEPAPISRSSISITITVPPHIVLSRADSVTDSALDARVEDFCIGASGLASYHVALAPSHGGLAPVGLRTHSGQQAGDPQLCGRDPGPGSVLHLDKAMVQAITDSAGPATLLIIPD